MVRVDVLGDKECCWIAGLRHLMGPWEALNPL